MGHPGVNYALFNFFTDVEANFQPMNRSHLVQWCKIIPDISCYISDATKKLKTFLERQEIPQDAVELLIINSKTKKSIVEKDYKNLCVISSLAFSIFSTQEPYIYKGDVPGKPDFYYSRYYSTSNDNGDTWRNYYRRSDSNDRIADLNEIDDQVNVFDKQIVAYIALTSDNEKVMRDKSIGQIVWVVEPLLQTFIVGDFVRVKGRLPMDFKGSYQRTPIVYSEDCGEFIVDFWTGWRKFETGIVCAILINIFFF